MSPLNIMRVLGVAGLLVWLGFDEHSAAFSIVVVSLYIAWAAVEIVDLRRHGIEVAERAQAGRICDRASSDRADHDGWPHSKPPLHTTRPVAQRPERWAGPDQ